MNVLEPADWTFPVPIRYGPGRVSEVAAVCREAGLARPLIVTDRGSRELPFIARIAKILRAEGLEASLFADFSPNPTDGEALAGKEAFEAGGHDGVIAVGGGSGMDGGKAVSLIAGRDDPLWGFDLDLTPPKASGFAPLICVPTTAGTGAETESTGMITDTDRGVKACIWHPAQKPLAAILDPELTLGLPRDLTAWTGCDALVHAVEAYCVPAFHPLCDGAALEGLRLIGGALETAVEEPGNLAARGAMLVGSCLAGISFLKGLGLVHAISHMVGARFDTHHGLTNAIVLPSVLRFNQPTIAEKAPAMGAALGFESRDAEGFLRDVCGLLDRLAIPKGLGEIGVLPNASVELAEKASRDPGVPTNPRQATVAEIEGIIDEAIAGAR